MSGDICFLQPHNCEKVLADTEPGLPSSLDLIMATGLPLQPSKICLFSQASYNDLCWSEFAFFFILSAFIHSVGRTFICDFWQFLEFLKAYQIYFVYQANFLFIYKEETLFPLSLPVYSAMTCEQKNILSKVGAQQIPSIHHSLITVLWLAGVQQPNKYSVSFWNWLHLPISYHYSPLYLISSLILLFKSDDS